MIPSLAVLVGFLAQAQVTARGPEPVRVWRADSIAYVTLREPGHLLLLHVDPIGRINVLFPLGPYDGTAVSADVAFAVPLPPTAQGNPATLVAVRSRWAFDFAALQGGPGGTWNYQNAWLLQATAGDPLGALLDIADRVTDARPYDYGVVTYLRDGTVASRGPPIPPQVCLSCVRARPPVAVAAGPAPTTAVDCSNASLTNSFCGVANSSVSITSVPAPQAAYQAPPTTAPVYVPYYLPIFVHSGRPRFDHSMRPAPPAANPQPPAASAFPIAPRPVVPSSTQLRSLLGRSRH